MPAVAAGRDLVAAPRLRAGAAGLAAAAASVAAAGLIARDPQTGGSIVAVLLVAPVLWADLALGAAAWAALVFIQGVPALNAAENALAAVLAVGWVAGMLAGGPPRATWRWSRRAVGLAALFLLWLVASVAWATDTGLVQTDLRQWVVAVYALPVVAVAASTRRGVRLLLAGFVVGAVASVVIGAARGDFAGEVGTHLARAAGPEARLSGGEPDPNFLAAGLVAALAFAGGLIATARSRTERVLLVGAIAVLGVGLGATGSRGGLIAAGVCLVGMLLLARRRLLHVAALGLLAAGAVAGVLASNDALWDRITAPDGAEGSGRVELWTVAWRMAQDHPVLGVGLNNYAALAPEYVRRPGGLESVEIIADVPHVVHNLYLQTLVESGVIGLVLLLALLAASCGSALLAGRSLRLTGDVRLSALAGSVAVGLTCFLVASCFLSTGSDKRLWILLGVGPGLLALARGGEPRPWRPVATP